MISRVALSILFVAGCVAASVALGQPRQGYPVKPIHLVSGFPPGGVNDTVARTIGTKLAESLATAVVVDNRPGAAGTLAAAMVARAEPNGYTLLMYSSGFAISAAIQESLPYDPLKDFAGVARIGPSTQALIVPTSLGVKSVKELVALAKAQPGKIILGSSGAGSGSHLIGEKFRLAAGMNVVHVGFKGNSDLLMQIAGGRVHYGISVFGPAMPLVKDGKLMILAVTTKQRSAVLPDVPTVAESLPGFSHEGGFGLMAPARTPRTQYPEPAQQGSRPDPGAAGRAGPPDRCGCRANSFQPGAIRQDCQRGDRNLYQGGARYWLAQTMIMIRRCQAGVEERSEQDFGGKNA